MKKVISLIMAVLVFIACSGCKAEDETKNDITTTQINTTVAETTTYSGITKEEAIAFAKIEIDYVIEDKFNDDYDLIVECTDLSTSFVTAEFIDGEWKIELMGDCRIEDFGTWKFIGRYAFEGEVTMKSNGLITSSIVTGLGKMSY